MTPGYKEILAQIGTQLGQRKKVLLKRTLLLTWPILLAIVFGYIAGQVLGEQVATSLFFTYPNILGVFGYVILAFLYSIIMNFTFEIEKRIWADSFFDGRNLTPGQSWAIAKALFWKGVMFRIRIFFRYQFPVLVGFLLVIGLEIYFLISTAGTRIEREYMGWSLGLTGILFLGLIIYSYYLTIKLRYAWFIFLDTYNGKPIDMFAIRTQMKTLNQAMKSEAFKKALVLELGTDSVRAVTNLAVSVIAEGVARGASVLSGSGALGQMVGGLTKTYSQELTRQVTSYANIVAMYMLYRSARKVAFGAEQTANEEVYKLGL